MMNTCIEKCPICGRMPKAKNDANAFWHIYCKNHWWSRVYHHHVMAYYISDAVEKWNEDAEKIRQGILRINSGTDYEYEE